MRTYPWLEGAVRHGRTVAAVLGVVAASGAIAGFLQTHAVSTLALGLLGAAALYVSLRVLVDVLDLVADTLLPK